MDQPSIPKRPSFNPVLSPERAAVRAERERQRQASLADALAAYAARGTPSRDDVQSAQHDGLQTLETWRSFTRSKRRLLELCLYETLDWTDVDELRAIIARTEREAAELADTVRRSRVTGVAWSDAVVVVGIKLLTALDDDRAKLANKKGWSKSTSPGGHWATAMLEIDRELAIKHGRTLLARHPQQLRHIDPAQTRKGTNP